MADLTFNEYQKEVIKSNSFSNDPFYLGIQITENADKISRFIRNFLGEEKNPSEINTDGIYKMLSESLKVTACIANYFNIPLSKLIN